MGVRKHAKTLLLFVKLIKFIDKKKINVFTHEKKKKERGKNQCRDKDRS